MLQHRLITEHSMMCAFAHQLNAEKSCLLANGRSDEAPVSRFAIEIIVEAGIRGEAYDISTFR